MFTKNRISKTVLALVLVATLMAASLSTAQAQGGPPPMFGDAGDAHPSAGAPNEAHVARVRFIYVNLGTLFAANGRQLGKAKLPEVSLNLFPDVNYTGVMSRAWKDRWGSYWTGTLKGVEDGYFYLTVVDGVFMAHVASTQGVYEVPLRPEISIKPSDRSIQIHRPSDPNAKFDPPGMVIPEGSLGRTADTGGHDRHHGRLHR